METGLIIYAAMMSVCVVFVITEYIISKLSNESRFKKWWRKQVVSDWTNHKKPL